MTPTASTRKDLRAFPDAARARAGYEVFRVQSGLDPTDWRPLSSIGDGVREIRVHTDREHRVIYVAKFAEAVFVLHVFEKKARKTARKDLDLAHERFRVVMADRARRR